MCQSQHCYLSVFFTISRKVSSLTQYLEWQCHPSNQWFCDHGDLQLCAWVLPGRRHQQEL